MSASAGVAIGLAVCGCGCGSNAPIDPGDLDAYDRVLVEGRLIAGGEVVDRANIRIDVLPLGCEGGPVSRWLDIHPDSQGRFREEIVITASTPAFRGCLEITVVPVGFAELTTTTVLIDEVQFVRLADDPFTVETEIEVELSAG